MNTTQPPYSPYPQQQQPQKPKSRISPLAIVLALSGAFFLIFLVASGLLFMSKRDGGTAEKGAGSPLFSKGSVAVVELKGVIMDSKRIVRKLETLEEDADVKAVVIQLNSPGGSVAPSQEIYEAVKRMKKPVVASMSSVAASGAYYVAMGADRVFANAGTITGSIGVIMEFANLERLYEWAKIQRYTIKTGKFKDAGADHRAMTPEEREYLQAMVDDVLKQFKTAVAEGRKMKPEEVDRIADGRIFSGSQAKSLNMIDELGTLDDAIKAAGKLAKIEGKPHVIHPARPKRHWLNMIIDDKTDEEAEAHSQGGMATRALDLVMHGLDGASGDGSQLHEFTPGIYWIWKGAR